MNFNIEKETNDLIEERKAKSIEYIKQNTDKIINVINAYLDGIYEATETLQEDESPEVLNFLNGQKATAKALENIREKVIKNDFNMSALEICRIGLAFQFFRVRAKKHIDLFTKMKEESERALEILLGEESLKFDFFNEE